jgi:hypothetical protein
MIRVKLTMPYWPIERQTPNHSGIWDNCQFIINQQVSECDYWVVCENLINTEETICPKENTILITHEPPTLGKYRALFLKQFATVITCHKNIKHKNPIFQQQGLPWHVGRMQRNHVNLSWSKDYDELSSVDQFRKDKEISVVSSSKDGTIGHRQRLEFIRILKDYFGEKIDIFGHGINEIEDKWDALARYKYHIALENCAVDDYWTEKLSDAYLAGCYPIYYGCPNIKKYFDVSSLAKIDITRPDQAIHIIEACLKEHRYENAQQHIKNARENILNKYNVFPMVCSVINTDKHNLNNAKYAKIKMLPRFSKPLPFLIKDLSDRFFYNLLERFRNNRQYREWARSDRPFPPPGCIRPLIQEERINEYNTWIKTGKLVPPPHIVKQGIVTHYAERFQPHILIETGTFMGEMVDACTSIFDQIYSIELSRDLFRGAYNRFSKQKHISIIHGDSVDILPEILLKIDEPCLFWLDGHYSGGFTAKGKKDTPILQEVMSILSHHIDCHIILIDDARCFNGQNDYPTIRGLRDVILSYHPDWFFEVKDDVIRTFKSNAF